MLLPASSSVGSAQCPTWTKSILLKDSILLWAHKQVAKGGIQMGKRGKKGTPNPAMPSEAGPGPHAHPYQDTNLFKYKPITQLTLNYVIL